MKLKSCIDYIVISLVLCSIVAISLETITNISVELRRALRIVSFALSIIFTIEYLSRVITAPKKLGYILSFYGIIDLLAILPFYLSFGSQFQAIRALRLLRIFRILKIARYNKAISRFGEAIKRAKEEILLFLFATVIILYIAALGIYYFEHQVQPENFRSVFDGLWWAIATLATVGYGDIYPITAGGKIFTAIILLCGLGIVAVPTGLVASSLSSVLQDEKEDEERNKKRDKDE